MNHKFDEFAKNMAQSITRRQAFKKFGVGLAGMAVACFGLANIAKANKPSGNACEQCIKYCENFVGGSKSDCELACSSVCT